MFISEIPDEGDYDTCDGYNYLHNAKIMTAQAVHEIFAPGLQVWVDNCSEILAIDRIIKRDDHFIFISNNRKFIMFPYTTMYVYGG